MDTKDIIEEYVAKYTKLIHPQDLGEPTSKLENTLRGAFEEIEQELLKTVADYIHIRCSDLRNEIARQEDEHGRRDDATATRLSEAERMYAMFTRKPNLKVL